MDTEQRVCCSMNKICTRKCYHKEKHIEIKTCSNDDKYDCCETPCVKVKNIDKRRTKDVIDTKY